MTSYLKKYIYNLKRRRILLLIASCIFIGFLGVRVNFDIARIINGIPSMLNLFNRILKPNFNYIREVYPKLIETIQMASIASVVGIVFSMPFSILISKNISPSPFLWRSLNLIFALLRTIPSLVWAAILVSIFSIGSFSGIVALSLTSFLVSLKMFKDYIESLEENLLDSTRAVGASNFQILKSCVLPTIGQQAFAIFFMSLEINIRGASILGFVGAGGIGQIMWRDLNHLRYDNLATLIIALFITIFLIDVLSLNVRKKFNLSKPKFKSIEGFKKSKKMKNLLILLVIVGIIMISYHSIGVNKERMILGLSQGVEIIRRMINVDWTYTDKLIEGLGESIYIALFATIVGSFLSLILSYFSAYNISRNKWSLGLAKGFTNLLRTFPSIITAIIFFRGVGPGPLAGALALSLYTTGVLSKLYSEVIESIPENLLNSIRVTGASPLAIYKKGVIPQTLPNFISLALYRLESNMRNSTILGIIGAGGVGTSLTVNITWRNWERVGLLILGISLTVFLIDLISNTIRKKYI